MAWSSLQRAVARIWGACDVHEVLPHCHLWGNPCNCEMALSLHAGELNLRLASEQPETPTPPFPFLCPDLLTTKAAARGIQILYTGGTACHLIRLLGLLQPGVLPYLWECRVA